jgi:hypothetical protein
VSELSFKQNRDRLYQRGERIDCNREVEVEFQELRACVKHGAQICLSSGRNVTIEGNAEVGDAAEMREDLRDATNDPFVEVQGLRDLKRP